MTGKIPAEVIESIRKEANIVDVIGQYVQLKKTGKNYSGLCPFHNEKTPSFSVSQEKQMFHCFGCGKGGTVFQFIQEIDGLSFPESVKKVAEMENIQSNLSDIAISSTFEHTINEKKQQLQLIHEKVAELYHHILLNTEVGVPALEYLEKRGMTKEQIELFQIGFAPAERNFLEKYLNQQQLDSQYWAETGLFIQKDDGELLDRFYQRIMFPIKNDQGRVIAFSGRILSSSTMDTKDLPKYLNSPETELFNKSQILFNFDKARPLIRKSNEVYLFEGFMDVIASYGAGILNGVASMGTSLTDAQIQKLKKVTDHLIICYDGDQAGMMATERALELFEQTNSFQLSVVSIPEKLDPDDYIQKYGKQAYVHLLEMERLTSFQYRSHYYQKDKNLQNESDLFEYLQKMIEQLARIPSAVEREVYIQQLSKDYGISTATIFQELDKLLRKNKNAIAQQESFSYENELPISDTTLHRKISRTEKAERILLYRMMHEALILNQIQQMKDFSFIHDEYQELYQHFSDYSSQCMIPIIAEFLNYLKDERLITLLSEIESMEISEESTQQEIMDCINQIRSFTIESAIIEKRKLQEEERRRGNQAREIQLTVEIIQLQTQLKKV